MKCVPCELGFHDDCFDRGSCDCNDGDCEELVSYACAHWLHNCPGCPCDCHHDPKARALWNEAHGRFLARQQPDPDFSIDNRPGNWLTVEHRPAINQPATHCLIDRTAPEGTQHVATFPVANDAEAVAAVLNGNDSEYRRLLNHLDEREPF